MKWYSVSSNWVLENKNPNKILECNFVQILIANSKFEAIKLHVRRVTYGKNRPKLGGHIPITKEDLRTVTVVANFPSQDSFRKTDSFKIF